MADDFPDLHHKLCKQVAALTTAIYYLNTKNDENESALQTYIEAYEQEMNNIVQSANQAINKFIQDNTQALELNKIQTSYKTFKSQIEEERASSIQEYKIFQELMKNKEGEIKAEADKQVNTYKLEVEGMKEKIWQMQKVVEKVSGDKIQFDDAEQKEKEKENVRIKKELEEKQTEALELRIKYAELERMYKELEENRLTTGRNWGRGSLGVNTEGSAPEDWELDMLRSKLAEQDRLIVALKKALTQENGPYDGEYIASIEFEASSRRETSTLGIPPNNLQKQVLESERIATSKQDETSKLQEPLKENVSDNRIEQMIEEYENRLKEASREHRKMIEKLHNEYSENIAEMENQFEKESMKWQALFQGMQNTLDNRNEYINGLEERINDLESAREKLEQEIQSNDKQQKQETAMNEEIQRLKQLLEEARKFTAQKLEAAKTIAEEERLLAIEEMKRENEKSLQILREDLNNKKSASEVQKEAKIKELETEIKRFNQYPLEQLEAKSKEIAEEYQNKVNELSKRQNAQIRELMEKHEEKISHITQKYETELSNIKKERQQEKDNILKMKEEDKNSEITHLKKDHEAQLKKISKSYDKQLAEKLQEYEAKIKSKELEILDLRTEIENAKEEIQLAFEKSQAQELTYKEMQKLIEDQKTTIDTLQDEIREGFLEEGGPTFRKELSKIKDGEFTNKGREEMILEHLKYAEKVEKKLKDIKKDYEERMRLWAQKYDELLAIFESRPSKAEDLEKIKHLEEELKKESEKPKLTQPESLKKEDFHVFTPQPSFSGATLMNSFKIKKNSKTMSMSPPNLNTSLPPISINQFSIQIRTPPAINPLTTTKKFFK